MTWRGLFFFVAASIASMTCAINVTAAMGVDNQLRQETTPNRPTITLFMAANGIDDALWTQQIVTTAQSAAQGLDIDLEVIFAGTVRPQILQTLKDRVSESNKPDYVVFGNQRGVGVEALKILNTHSVNAFLYIAPLLDKDYQSLGGPRGSLEHWIGQLIPNDEAAGYDLAQTLIADARQRHPDLNRNLRMVGFAGRRSTTSAAQRLQGLYRAVAEHSDVDLVQVISGRWQQDVARQKYELFLKRQGAVDIVWAANDPMALGVIDILAEGDHSVSVGGVDWIPPALDALQQNRLVASMGGHYIDIAFTLALLRGHYDGIDFAAIAGTPALTSRLIPMTPTSVDAYLDFINATKKGDVDFRLGLSGLDSTAALSDLTIDRFIEQVNGSKEKNHDQHDEKTD